MTRQQWYHLNIKLILSTLYSFKTWPIHTPNLLLQEDPPLAFRIQVYHAIASVMLTQIQDAIDHGTDEDGTFHAWYRDSEGKQVMK